MNHLANSTSPYLLQHASNPVDWYPWGEEALEKARREDRPIFLSIGYAACHWCHVMAHESFEDPETARIMNRYFVNIKVDREERPDLDDLYMQAVVAMTGQGGWPMSVFLTPEGIPFYGGTYFPPVRRYNMPAFREVLLALAQAWQNERENLLAYGKRLHTHLRTRPVAPQAAPPPDAALLEQAARHLAETHDEARGGWGKAPKFPQPMAITFLLSQPGAPQAETAFRALERMARGGMYDVVGGGFARYSTDDNWLVPHFEKMLYDNALLARAYLQAALQSGRADFRRTAERTLDFLLREMRHPAGGFFSSLDADSEGQEGKFYLWDARELRALLGEDYDFFAAAYNVTEQGNWEGRMILQRSLHDAALAKRFGMTPAAVPTRLETLHARLLAARAQRVRPATDDKVLTAWNGLALSALAEAARYLGRADYLQAARQNADFLLTHLRRADGRLHRAWRAGQAAHTAMLEDYAALGLGLLALYQSDPQTRWYQAARQMAENILTHFPDAEGGGFFDTPDDHPTPLARPKSVQDNATPSGNALTAMLLLQLHAFSGEGRYYEAAQRSFGLVRSAAARYPTAFAYWLCAMQWAVYPPLEVALIGASHDASTQALRTRLWQEYRPRLVFAASDFPPPPEAPPLLQNRPLVNGKPAAYVCRGFVCRTPVTTPEALAEALNS